MNDDTPINLLANYPIGTVVIRYTLEGDNRIHHRYILNASNSSENHFRKVLKVLCPKAEFIEHMYKEK
jgi:hypothetical protein